MTTAEKITFPGANGEDLAARLELPAGPIRAYALFAHCFTCTKDTLAATRIAGDLAKAGFAVLRFDFTGLGGSGGDFANTNFTSNVDDLKAAADFLRERYEAPAILIGHSLGGAAVLAAAGDIADAKAVVTLGAPADVEHVLHNFHSDIETIEREGEAEVKLAGRPFTIRKSFVDDAREQNQKDLIAKLKKALLVMHAPLDDIVGIDNATAIFVAAKHPKSFISLDGANHLLTRRADAEFAASVIASWASRYIPAQETAKAAETDSDARNVTVRETGNSRFEQKISVGPHSFLADEPPSVGGTDNGPTPYDLLAAGLGACTAMTLRMYADHKGLELGKVSVSVSHGKVHAKDCEDCADDIRERSGKVDRFERVITVEGGVPDDLKDKVLEIADKCPVHRTIETGAAVVTKHGDE